MLQRLKRSWEEFERGTPGKRFQERYERRQKKGGGTLAKVFYVGGGIVVLAAGLFFLPAPGPGFLILFLGAGMIAQESLAAARVLDWIEPRIRAVLRWARDVWNRSSMPVKALLVLVAAALAAGAAYVAYRTFFGA